MENMNETINAEDLREIARLIGQGYTSGRLDVELEDGSYKFIAWELVKGELKTSVWID